MHSVTIHSSPMDMTSHIPPLAFTTPAGSMRSFFRYQLDCRDRSFNRIGDTRVPGAVPKGWQPVENDPTALAVANAWCLRLQALP